MDESLTGDALVRVAGEAREELLVDGVSARLCIGRLTSVGETVGRAGSSGGGSELNGRGSCNDARLES